MGWHARLALSYSVEAARCVARFEHEGPLRILQTLYPEGDAIAHNVLVHPPGGIVGGDTLEIALRAAAGSHALVTTPGASRFYRSDGAPATQRTRITLGEGARLEWMPLESICHDGCVAHNELSASLAPGAEMIGWDIVALGLPEAGLPFRRGRLVQHLELQGQWLDRGLIDAADSRLMDGPLGLAGRRCMATLYFACGSDIPRERREEALQAARDVLDAHELAGTAGATAPGPRMIVVRVLAPLVEPAMQLLKSVRAQWRQHLWGLLPVQPRTWAL